MVMRTLPAGQGPGWWRWCCESSVPSILYPGKEAESIVQGTEDSVEGFRGTGSVLTCLNTPNL